MLGVFKRLWAAIKIKAPRRARRHGYGWRSIGSGYGYGARPHSEPVRGPKNDWGATRGPGF